MKKRREYGGREETFSQCFGGGSVAGDSPPKAQDREGTQWKTHIAEMDAMREWHSGLGLWVVALYWVMLGTPLGN